MACFDWFHWFYVNDDEANIWNIMEYDVAQHICIYVIVSKSTIQKMYLHYLPLRLFWTHTILKSSEDRQIYWFILVCLCWAQNLMWKKWLKLFFIGHHYRCKMVAWGYIDLAVLCTGVLLSLYVLLSWKPMYNEWL